ncbi:unnamed protein product [Mucor fragilis]
MPDSNTYNDNVQSWAAHMDTDTEEPTIKKEPGGFEPWIQEHRECRFGSRDTTSLKREREQDDMDQVQSDNDAQYLDCQVKGGDVGELCVKGEPVTMKQLDVIVQQSPTTQEAVQDVIEDEQYCCGCNEIIPASSPFRQHIQDNHSRKTGIRNFHLKPNIDDPDNYCKACKRHFKTRVGYFLHLRRIHNFDVKKMIDCVNQRQFESSTKTHYFCCGSNQYMRDQASLSEHMSTAHYKSKIKHFHLMPDFEDPNNYCKACERYFASRPKYTAHLRLIHKLIKATATMEDVDQLGVDPNNYCCGCNQYLPDQMALMSHIGIAHRKTQIKNFNVKPDMNPSNHYCTACEHKFDTRKLYTLHLRLTHKLYARRPKYNRLQIPTISSTEPEYYCSACDRSIKQHSTYLAHITSRHINSKIKHINVKPDIDDPQNYCKACEKVHSSKRKYRFHLKLMHKIVAKEAQKIQIPAISTTESEYYCSACNTTVGDYSSFVAHITTEHPTSKIKHIHIKPDIHDPYNYCRACERVISTSSYYRYHLKLVHKILVDPTPNDTQHLKSTHPIRNYPLETASYQTETAVPFDTLQTALDKGTIPVQQALQDKKRTDLHKAKNYCHYCEMQYEGKAEF